jgi:arylsulfatase A-like enzyme
VGLSALGARTAAQQAGGRPNILLIVSDDQGYGDLSSHGNQFLKTPNLDRLGRDGVELTRFHACPVCAPTRSSLMTGRYHLRSNVHGVTAGREMMSLAETTIADKMRTAGYRTALFGKWHLGMHYPYVPHGRGFEEFIGFRTGHFIDYFDPLLEHNGQPLPEKGYITEVLTDHAMRYIEAHRQDPFFVYLAYNVPHMPYMVPPRYWEEYSKKDIPKPDAAAYALTACMDDNIGRLLQHLATLGLERDTVVFFMSDNGPNGQRYNAGLHGTKGSVYEGGTREPFFARWPGRFKAGMKVDRIASVIDLHPTILDLCGVANTTGLPLDGRSLKPLLTGSAAEWPERALFTHGERPAAPSAMFPGAIRTQNFNLVNGTELYNVAEDFGERINAAEKFPDEARRLRATYEKWFQDVLPPGGFKRLPLPIGYAEENPASLPAPEAYLASGLEYYGQHGYAWDWVTKWTSLEQTVHWEVDVHRAGEYEVAIEYLCPAGSTGSEVEVRAGETLVRGVIAEATPMEPIVMRDVVARSEVPKMHWKTQRLGKMSLSTGGLKITVRAVSKPGPVVMDLNRVLLKMV